MNVLQVNDVSGVSIGDVVLVDGDILRIVSVDGLTLTVVKLGRIRRVLFHLRRRLLSLFWSRY